MISEKELIRRAKKIDEPPTWCLFWPGGLFYGQGKWVKKYGFYPEWLPLPVWTDHSGPLLWDDVLPMERNINPPHLLKMSRREVDLHRCISQVNIHTILCPFTFYRRQNNIQQNPKAQGTVVFPAHSISTANASFDGKEYIDMLYKLPEKYHPITICMFYFDILKNRHKEYAKYFSITTCGHREDAKFMERFYEIVRQHRYATSNAIGSYLFYAVECGLPFFLYGPNVSIDNKNNENFSEKEIPLDSQKIAQRAEQLFSERVDDPTPEQRDFVERELGVQDSISRLFAAYILYKSLFQFLWWKVKRKLFEPKKEDDLPPLLSSRR